MSGRLIVIKGGTAYDMSNLVLSVRLGGRKGSAARSLQVQFIDDDGYGHDRTGLDIEEGQQCIYYWQEKELFRGLFMKQEQATRKTLIATAYDIGIYLANNKDTFNFTDTTASDIFVKVCQRFGIPYGAVASTGYRIPELPKPKTTGWDVICDALSLTYKATGVRYYPACIGDEMRLLERRENVLQWVLETGVNVEDYTLTKSIENIKTRIKLLSKEGTVLAEETDSTLEKMVGIFQEVVQVNDEMNDAQLTELVKSTLAENNKPERMLTIRALGLPDVITGIGVFINVPELGIAKTYYVEEDLHTFRDKYHTMQLKLVLAQDTDMTLKTASKGGAEIDEVVQFTGGPHYASSTAASPTGGSRTAGPAKCTQKAPGALHPYHLIGGAYTSVDGDSNVYGWVDASQISM